MLKETINLKKVQTVSTTSPTGEVLTPQQTEWVKIKGVLTSQIRTRASSNTPYYAFLRVNNSKHSLLECQQFKCRDCEIPIIFRLSSNHKPNLDKSQQALLIGQWATSDQSQRPSFTVYSYQKADE